MHDKNYEEFANAIIIQAVKDYRQSKTPQAKREIKRFFIYIDEAHLFFANKFSSEFLARAWKRFRKYGGLITGITQNVSECLASPTAKLMLSNSEFVIMLNQSAPDREELAPLMNISPTQIGYIDNAPSGQGVMRVGPNIIPFVNRFPQNTELYKLMTTKPSESQI